MGFEVTATHIIFFVAFLTVGSAALGSYFKGQQYIDEARRAHDVRFERLAKSNLTLSVFSCSGGCTAPNASVALDVANNGGVVVDHQNLTYLVEGRAYTLSDVTSQSIVSPAVVTGTDLILPGETMRITIGNAVLTGTYTTASLPVQVAYLDGVIGRR
jgi:archaellum component FlaF (FlaF/FlaG flagellin family)